ncbi:hypothetical protein BN1723_000900 [Verticillium longisporum]|uniref:Uncharacterized protein n=1 Tax=Verticillium longisporum TaxID=100787 RepID=A0A0G4NCX1_VERLO|nr:hypothetical protein BN1723_000900 [Verticillium longisporum]
MQRADSPGPTELDGLIERAYQEFADVTELLADEQRDAEAAASAEVPVLQQMIDLKQKEVEQLEPRVLQLKTEQEAARQKIASLNARVEAARGRSRRVATLAGRVSGKIMSSTRPQSPKLAKSSNARQLRQNNTGSSAHPRRSSGVSTSSEAGRLPLEAPKDARLACGETSSSCSLIPSRSIEVSEPRAALSLPDSPGITIAGKETTECPDSENTGHRPRATPPPSCGRDIRRSGRRRTTPQRFSTNSAFSQSAIDSEKIMKRRRLHHDDGSSDRSGDTTQAQRNLWMRRASSPSELAVDNPGILPNTVSANARRKQKPLKGVANPETGKLYLGRWDRGSGSTWYIVVILPIGDLESVGMTGSIHDTALVDGHIPVFYNSWQKRILGWKEDYKDGGPYVARRKYPVMWFEDGRQMILREGRFQISSSGGFSWLSASNLLPFSEYGPDNSLVSGYAVALSFAEELEAMDVSRRARIEVPAASKEVYDGSFSLVKYFIAELISIEPGSGHGEAKCQCTRSTTDFHHSP